jgi:O-antigen/teichoic acid export membrane protein
LKKHAVKGGAATVATQAAMFIISFGSVPILGRLLTPADFGLVAMVAAVTGFVGLFKDAGLSMATVQRDRITHAQISTLFWFNVCLSVMLALILACLAPAVAWFYGEPRLELITLAVAGTFIFSGLTVQHAALLRRQMRFGTIGIISIISRVVSIISGITAAVLGAGYWALIIMTATDIFTNAMLVWLACGWRPGFPQRGTGVRPMLAFGGSLAGAGFLTYIRRNLDKFLLGWMWGAGTLGIYSKAYKLLLMPLNQFNKPISKVALPVLSRLQNQPDRYRRYYRMGIEMSAALGMPLVFFAALDAETIILTLLGDQWREAIPIFRALSPAALLGTLNGAGSWIFVSTGRTDKQLKAHMCSTVFVVLAMFIGLTWGAIGVAVAFSASTCLMYLPVFLYAVNGSAIRPKDLLLSMWHPSVASLAAATTILLIKQTFVLSQPMLVNLLMDAALFFVLYLIVFALLPGGKAFLKQVTSTAMELQTKP